MRRRGALVALACLAACGTARAQGRSIVLASTTSTEQSGLFGHLLPLFAAKTGIEVRVVAVGTGQALAIGARGDADVLLVHDRAGEDAFIASGLGVDRRDVMHNDLVIVGPAADPAGIRGGSDAGVALVAIAAAEAPFAARGDDSGTSRAELRLWRAAGVDPMAATGDWYRETGSGMGPTLNVAAGIGAYALTDRATWASFKNRQGLTILLEGDPRLANPYGSILVSPARHPHVNAAAARIWHEWLTSPEGQRAIAAYRIAGEQVFFPDSRPPGS